MAATSLLEAVDLSNLRARVKLLNAGVDGDPGSRADNDVGRSCGVDVWLDDFASYSVGDFEEALSAEFSSRSELHTYLFLFHYAYGSAVEDVALVLSRDERPVLQFMLGGGVPWEADAAFDVVRHAFVAVGASVESVEHCSADDEDYWFITLYADDASASFGEVRDAVQNTRSALCTFRGEIGPGRYAKARRSLLEGRFDDLVGEVECDWLECKVKLAVGKREDNMKLVKYVSGFANAHRSALLVVGMKTSPVDGRDEVVATCPLPARAHSAEQYTKIIDEHVYPPVVGLEVDAIGVDGGVVVVVSVPAQRLHSKPFVVTFPAGRGSDTHHVHSLYQRRGDRTVPVPIEDFHAFLATGHGRLRNTRVRLDVDEIALGEAGLGTVD
jgi:hypothetical protein